MITQLALANKIGLGQLKLPMGKANYHWLNKEGNILGWRSKPSVSIFGQLSVSHPMRLADLQISNSKSLLYPIYLYHFISLLQIQALVSRQSWWPRAPSNSPSYLTQLTPWLLITWTCQQPLILEAILHITIYHKVSNISRTKCQNLNVSRLGLQLSLRNILKQSIKWRMKM